MAASITCPCCGQLVAGNGLVISLDANTVTNGKHSVRVNRRTAEFLLILNQAGPTEIPYERLIVRLFGGTASQVDPHNLLSVYACLARKAVRQLGFDVRSTYGCGYRLVRQ